MEESKNILGKRMVPEEDFFAKVQQLRSALPKSMKEAEDLMKKAEAVVRSAQAEADRLIDTAERDAEKLVTDARNRSERAIGEAKNHVDRLTTDAQNKAARTIEAADAQATRTVEAANAQATRTIDEANAQATRTIDEANDRAAHVEDNAQKQANALVAEDAITKHSQEEADARLNAAKSEAEELRRNADDYAFEVLDKISGALDKLNISVEAGKESLRANTSTYGDDLKDPYAPSGGYANSDFNGAR